MEQAVFWLSFSFGIHIVLVNIGIGISILSPLLRYLAERGRDDGLMEESYRLIKFYAATYALGGVFGTAFTVFLLSFYPGFISLLGKIAFYNFSLAIASIALHFLSLTIYYYGWSRLEPRLLHVWGLLLAITALLIPLGFRSVFAQLNKPVGIAVEGVNEVYLNPIKSLLGNPLLPPLYLKSVSASLALTLVLAAAWASLKGRHSIARLYLKPALVALVVVALSGAWYGYGLKETVEYKFNNIFGGLGIGGEPLLNLSWLLVAKIALWSIQVTALAYALVRGPRRAAKPLALASLAAILAVVAGEYLNAFSQYPRFIADPSSLFPGLESWEREKLEEALSLLNTNINTKSSVLTLYTITATSILLLAAILYLYIALSERKAPTTPTG